MVEFMQFLIDNPWKITGTILFIGLMVKWFLIDD
jgi:hypothetical protein